MLHEGRRPGTPRARAPSAQGARRLRRDAAREPPPRPPTADRLRDAARVQERRARRRGHHGREPASRSTRSSRSTTSSAWSRPRTTRAATLHDEGLRPRPQGAHRLDRREVHQAQPKEPTSSPSCTSRSRASTTSSCAARPARCSSMPTSARVPRLADDVHRLPAGDRVRPQGHGVRAERARGDGVSRRPHARTSAASATTSRLVGKHVGNRAEPKYVEAEKRLGTTRRQARAGVPSTRRRGDRRAGARAATSRDERDVRPRRRLGGVAGKRRPTGGRLLQSRAHSTI